MTRARVRAQARSRAVAACAAAAAARSPSPVVVPTFRRFRPRLSGRRRFPRDMIIPDSEDDSS